MSGFGNREMYSNIHGLNMDPSDIDLNLHQSNPAIPFDPDLSLFTNPADFGWHEASPQQYPSQDPTSAFPQEANFFAGNDFSYNDGFAQAQHPMPPFQVRSSPALSSNGQKTPVASSPGGSAPSAQHSSASKRAGITGNGSEEVGTPADDDNSRRAADEDKRRRNTAASARFRVKKKQREQAMETMAREMGDRVKSLEKQVGRLESENKFLRDLITEKEGTAVNFDELKKAKAAEAASD